MAAINPISIHSPLCRRFAGSGGARDDLVRTC
jgi:hypothetical protein